MTQITENGADEYLNFEGTYPKARPTLKQFALAFFLVLISASINSMFSQSSGYVENKGQWDDEVVGRFYLPNGAAWFFNDRVRFPLVEEELLHEAHEFSHENPDVSNVLSGHCYEMVFSSESNPTHRFVDRVPDYVNYFIGKDRSKWAGRVGIFKRLHYSRIAKGVDLDWSMDQGRMKYTFRIDPNTDPSFVGLEYNAVRKLELREGNLVVTLPNLEVIEQSPYVYQLVNGREVEVKSGFVIEANRVSFSIGNYDPSLELFIDPVIVASTNIGATVTTYGHSATYDQFGNIIGGGRPFGAGYPSDTGSFQMDFAGGGTDIGISKLNEDGSQLLWSTYIGGATSDEYVHSLVVNGFNQVVVLGKTSSSDYPVAFNAYDTTFNGAEDICITILSDSGDSIIGSTYVGGESNDGQNTVPASYAGFKGEVVCDLYSNVYVASTSSSDSFPTSNGAYQATRDSLQDAVVFKMTYNLTGMLFSTYLGTEGNDAAFNLKPAKDNTVYVTGATSSGNFPTTSGAHDETFNTGTYDAFITRFDQNGHTILNSTFIESDSNGDDKGLFLQIDRHHDIYVMGSSTVITGDTNKYMGPGAGSFIRKYGPELDTLEWTSTFASLRHSAFLVDNCKNIYAAGNQPGSVDTVDAVQATQGGFYVMVLSPEADTILMGSYYGTTGSHVDGGTSRFDKRGAVYQATCTNGAFPLTSTAWSGNQNGGSYDLTVFKIDMEIQAAVANAQIAPNSVGCAPYTANFTNFGSQGLSHYWDFKDGDTSNLATPSHTFNDPGVYEVDYVIFDTGGCVLSDTATLIIVVHDSTAPEIVVGPTECVDEVVLTTTSAYASYEWSTGAATQTITTDSVGEYWLQITNSCGSYSDTVQIDYTPSFSFILPPDTGICDPNFFLSGPDSAINYLWNSGDTTQTLTIPNTGVYTLIADNGTCADTDSIHITVAYTNISSQDTVLCVDSAVFAVNNDSGSITWSTGDTVSSITIDSAGTYWVKLENGYCTVIDTIDVIIAPLELNLPSDTAICSPIFINAFDSTFVSYLWSDSSTDSSLLVIDSGSIWLEVSNAHCSDADTMRVDNIVYIPSSGNNQFYCDTFTAPLAIVDRPGADFLWSTGDTTNVIIATESGRYIVTISEGICNWLDTFEVQFAKTPEIDIPNYEMCEGDSVIINADTSYSNYIWSNTASSSSIVVKDSGSYWVSINNNGCEKRHEFQVSYLDASRIGSHSVPNVLTPNSDGINDVLFIDINDYSVFTHWTIDVYNRWGSLVYHSSEPTIRWEGRTFTGEPLKPGVYYYIIDGSTICLQKETVGYRGSITILE